MTSEEAAEADMGETTEEPADESKYSVRAVARVCSILNFLQASSEATTLTDIASRANLPLPTTFRYLATLEDFDYVERDADSGKYRLGLAFATMQSRELELFIQRALPFLERLRSKFEETVNLGFLDGTRVIYLEILESPKAMRLAARPGDRDPIHSTALGKAIAAHLTPARVQRILADHDMSAYTERTITDAEAYLAELERVRDLGYALDDLENEPDGRCVAVAVPHTRLPVAISVSAPASRLSREMVPEVADELSAVAELIGSKLSDDD